MIKELYQIVEAVESQKVNLKANNIPADCLLVDEKTWTTITEYATVTSNNVDGVLGDSFMGLKLFKVSYPRQFIMVGYKELV